MISAVSCGNTAGKVFRKSSGKKGNSGGMWTVPQENCTGTSTEKKHPFCKKGGTGAKHFACRGAEPILRAERSDSSDLSDLSDGHLVQCVPCAFEFSERRAVWSVGWQGALCRADTVCREVGLVGLVGLVGRALGAVCAMCF